MLLVCSKGELLDNMCQKICCLSKVDYSHKELTKEKPEGQQPEVPVFDNKSLIEEKSLNTKDKPDKIVVTK